MWKNIQPRLQFEQTNFKQHKAFEEFDEINALIDWDQIIIILNKLSEQKPNRLGAASYAPIMMFKVVLLQSWHNLSDVKMENMLARDLLFRQFVGLHMHDSIPDHSSIWRFRDKLQKADLVDTLFHNINEQLAQQSIIVKEGSITIIDATVVKALNNRPNKNKQGENTQDKDGSYSVKKGSDGKVKSTFGFKVHAASDEDGFVMDVEFTTGSVHDSNVFETLLTGNETAVYADSAYASEKTTALLKDKGIENNILRRAYRNRPLTKEDISFNRARSGIRSRVESIFGIGKMHIGMGQARYKGLVRNALSCTLRCIVLNLKRAKTIKKELNDLQAKYA